MICFWNSHRLLPPSHLIAPNLEQSAYRTSSLADSPRFAESRNLVYVGTVTRDFILSLLVLGHRRCFAHSNACPIDGLSTGTSMWGASRTSSLACSSNGLLVSSRYSFVALSAPLRRKPRFHIRFVPQFSPTFLDVIQLGAQYCFSFSAFAALGTLFAPTRRVPSFSPSRWLALHNDSPTLGAARPLFSSRRSARIF